MPARDIQCHRFHLNGKTSLQCYMLLSAVMLPLCLYVSAVTFTYPSGVAQRDSWLVTRLPPRPHLALRPATNITSRFPIVSHQRPCTSRHTSVLHTLANIVRNIERWQRIDSSNYPKKTANCTVLNFCSRNRMIQTEEVNKICLSAFDDKRYIISGWTAYRLWHTDTIVSRPEILCKYVFVLCLVHFNIVIMGVETFLFRI